MASPPYNHSYTSAISPPYPSHAQLPQPPKRRQSDMPSSAPAIKRRKASMLSTTSGTSSAHPLRQTSFPPENSGVGTFSRSPSMDTMSIASGAGPGPKRKKGRKGKGGKGNDDIASVNGKKAKSIVSAENGATGGAGRKRRGSTAAAAEDEEEEDAGETMALNVDAASKEEKAKEERRRQVLVRAFEKNGDQFSSKSPPELWGTILMEQIVNQTLSQSVPPNVILAIKSAAKIFAGEIIEGARKVQTEWVEVNADLQNEIQMPTPPAETNTPVEKEKEKRRGPLLPDHLREAFRRHMLEGDGGLVGELGLWQHQNVSGVERFGTKIGGKRLFK
ncbi:related to transcription initiation factor IID beta chain [Phialocephala subalpina]|uniref:Related to transcription initiation factor IID beta chain n=1 Tax=Phialocephala subalpina TaxID=576137 RepID=A0A1L7WUL7_9HELO|nr:related to transcription initiation factor IID beta chain [Phialocephala subalpina]